jgi:hypothetical protein
MSMDNAFCGMGDSSFSDGEDTTSTTENRLRKRIEELEHAVQFLWDLIDDIDTASDIAKSDDVWYRKRVECLQGRRWTTGITTDGYDLDTTKLTGEKYQDTFKAADVAQEAGNSSKKQDLGSRNTIGGMLKDNDTGEVSEPTTTHISDFPEDLK